MPHIGCLQRDIGFVRRKVAYEAKSGEARRPQRGGTGLKRLESEGGAQPKAQRFVPPLDSDCAEKSQYYIQVMDICNVLPVISRFFYLDTRVLGSF
jgi:hypothetical protein